MAVSDRLLQIKVLGNWQRQAATCFKTISRSCRFAAHQGAHKALESWYWNASFTKGHLRQWTVACRANGNINRKAHQYHNARQQRHVLLVLNTWRDESSNDWGASKLLTAAWVAEWHGLSHDHAGTRDRATGAWDVTLKSRYWSQWQTTLLQLKSREYVALNVREGNHKKLVRRLLLHWKGDRDLGGSTNLRTSLANSRRVAGNVVSSTRASLQLSRAVHERPIAPSGGGSRMQETGPTVEEEDHEAAGSGGDIDGVVVDTPTRWTGMASSVRLPSMTPFAPLPTPFERELRERYNRSMPTSTMESTGQLSRLSFRQAQRASMADIRRAAQENQGQRMEIGTGKGNE
ncbi:hypothetical protein CCHL11_04813 [Colletotrichum chlorophyti]|uniref:Uncharacterized protein n=1 Tax=Colletotrichum chlorophyti TaxID=708187 RepID=A0A1Q8S1S0_9PEZI|nr:hypothetical protein CCHL11_04813 [Colletotrichum chlorophyti]